MSRLKGNLITDHKDFSNIMREYDKEFKKNNLCVYFREVDNMSNPVWIKEIT